MSNNKVTFKQGDRVMWVHGPVHYGRYLRTSAGCSVMQQSSFYGEWWIPEARVYPAVRRGEKWQDMLGREVIVRKVDKERIYCTDTGVEPIYITWADWFAQYQRATGCEGGCCSWRNTDTGVVECANCGLKFGDPLPPSAGTLVAHTSPVTQTPATKHEHVKFDTCKYANGVKIEGTDRAWYAQDHRTEVYGPVAQERRVELIVAGRSVVYRTHRVWPQCPVTGQPILVAPHMKDDISGYAVLRCFCC